MVQETPLNLLKDHIRNKVRNRIRQHIGQHDDLLTMIKKRKMKCYSYVRWSDGLAKTVLHGTVQGKKRRGRRKKKWADNISEWTVKKIASTQALSHDRQKWNQLVRWSDTQCPHDQAGYRTR